MILKMDTELGSEVKLTPPDGVQSFHVQHLPHPHSGISDCFIVTSDQWHHEATLRDINRQITQSTYQNFQCGGYLGPLRRFGEESRSFSSGPFAFDNIFLYLDENPAEYLNFAVWFVCRCPVALPRYAIGRS